MTVFFEWTFQELEREREREKIPSINYGLWSDMAVKMENNVHIYVWIAVITEDHSKLRSSQIQK